MMPFQELLRLLSAYWEKQGCTIHQGYDLEVGAGTLNPATFLRSIGPEPYRAAYIEPCRRPTDGRYGLNPNRLQHYFQFQVILKPSPMHMQELYIDSLKAIGIDLNVHDIRFVHDDWENPTIGAWGLGWEVWLDGMEITQFTYFQSVGGQTLKPITGELTYGLERIAMYLQGVDRVFDLNWNGHLTYGDIYLKGEVEWCHYNFEQASTDMWRAHFEDFEREAKRLIAHHLPIPAYEFVMKASHAFNILNARGAISVTERATLIGRVRDLACAVASEYLASREKVGFPLLHRFPIEETPAPTLPPLSPALLKWTEGERGNYLFELGLEELPASFVPIGVKELEKAFKSYCEEMELSYEKMELFGTPRRLAILIKGLIKGIPSKTVEKRGPLVSKAFDEKGSPTAIGEGFFRSMATRPLLLTEINNGDTSFHIAVVKGSEYLFYTETKEATATATLLSRALPKIIGSLRFPKVMQWGSLDLFFPRPLRFLVSLFDAEIVPFAIGPFVAGRTTYGHRQRAFKPLTLSSALDYVETLKKGFVLPDRVKRRHVIEKALEKYCETEKATLPAKEAVLSQVVDLTEWPEVIAATFDQRFLSIPKEILISEMCEHQKDFPVADLEGNLRNVFLITSDASPTEEIRAGNERVLSARFSDGLFLYEKDLKLHLMDFQEKLKTITFLTGFGSLFDKKERLRCHVRALIDILSLGDKAKADKAADLSKIDLASEVVGEFPELQGTVGKYYALAKKEDPEVAEAIEEQWKPRGEKDSLPITETGFLLSLADKFDNLLCCFGARLKPTSSSDPYALRRQTLAIIRMILERKIHIPIKKTLEVLSRHFNPPLAPPILDEIESFFQSRIRTVLEEVGFRKDEIAASLSKGITDVMDAFNQVKALQKFREKSAFFALYEVYKRAKGQLPEYKGEPFDETLLKEKAEKALYETILKIEAPLAEALKKSQYEEGYSLLATLQPPLDALFTEVWILTDDLALRANRLSLLKKVFTLFDTLLDFSKIEEKGA